MKIEITDEQIATSYIYQEAVKVSEHVVVPELSKESETYLATLNEYREILSELNKSGFGRWTHINTYTEDGDFDKFRDNLNEFQEIHKNLDLAEQLHTQISKALEDGTHLKLVREIDTRTQVLSAKRAILTNARKSARLHLEDIAKTKATLDRKKAKQALKSA